MEIINILANPIKSRVGNTGLAHVVSRAECVSIFDADLRKYVIYPRVDLSDLIGRGLFESKNAFIVGTGYRTRIARVTGQ